MLGEILNLLKRIRIKINNIFVDRTPSLVLLKKHHMPNVGWFESIGILVILGVFLLLSSIYWSFTPTGGLLFLAALSGWIALFRLRRSSAGELATVRPDFGANDDSGRDFGFKNYGPGPALYLQARLVCGNHLFDFEPRKHPLHLEENEFLGLIRNDSVELTHQGDGRHSVSDLLDDSAFTDETIYFHYSYVSKNGGRTPNLVSYDPKKDGENILEPLQDEFDRLDVDGREISVERIREEIQ